MAYKKIETTIWKDPWFVDLSAMAKLSFIYLWTTESCNAAGCYPLSLKVFAFEAGLGSVQQAKEVLYELKDKVVYYEQHQIVWIKNHTIYQAQNNKYWKGALATVERFPEQIKNDWVSHYTGKFPTGVAPIHNITDTDKKKDTTTAQSENSDRKKSVENDKVVFDRSSCKFQIPVKKMEVWKETFPAVDIVGQIGTMEAWLMSNPKNRKQNYERRMLANNFIVILR